MPKTQYQARDQWGNPVPMEQGQLLFKIETGMSTPGVMMPYIGRVYDTAMKQLYMCYGANWSRTLGELESWVTSNV